jgi:adenylosuccinate lyase
MRAVMAKFLPKKNMRRDKLKNMSYEERKEIIQKNRNNMTEEKKQKIKSLIQKRRQSKNEERNRRKYNNTSQ